MAHFSGNLEKIAKITDRLVDGSATDNAQGTRVFDLPVIVDHETCIKGCKVCIESCPVDCLAIDPERGKAFMAHDDCWYCLACEVDCPTNSIVVKIPYLLR